MIDPGTFPALSENSLPSRQFDHLDTPSASLPRDAPSAHFGYGGIIFTLSRSRAQRNDERMLSAIGRSESFEPGARGVPLRRERSDLADRL